MKMKIKYAYNLMEIMLALLILGTIIALTLSNAKKKLPDVDKSRFKKAYTVTEKTVNTLINDENIYPYGEGFRNLEPVQTEFGETFGLPDENTKFRDAFKYNLDVIEDNINCPIPGNTKNACFKTDDGIVYGIPDTDFITKNLQETTIERASGEQQIRLLPITIYTDWEKISENADYENDALFIGVRSNGEIRLINVGNVNCSNNSDAIQCKAMQYLQSNTLTTQE